MLPTAHSQAISIASRKPVTVCPGGFPTDLNQLSGKDCAYTQTERTVDFLSGSVTDQAVVGAVVFGLGAQISESPSEWKRTWDGYGRRVGSRYTQAVGKGAAQYIVGSILRDDPRPLSYRDEPKVIEARYEAVSMGNTGAILAHDGWQRFGHAWFDTITVRRSAANGNGRRIRGLSMVSGCREHLPQGWRTCRQCLRHRRALQLLQRVQARDHEPPGRHCSTRQATEGAFWSSTMNLAQC